MDGSNKYRWSTDCTQELPIEIWEIVLTQTFDFTQRRYYVNANQLEFFRTNFPQLKVVLEKLKTSYLFEKVFKVIIGYLKQRDIYQCRLICKRWTAAVDGFLENPTCFEAYDQPNYVVQRRYSFDFHMEHPVDLGHPSRLDCFESIMANVTTNPFIGRYIRINPKISNMFWENFVVEDINQNHSIERLCQILQRLGEYVWHLEWHVIGSTINGITFYAALCRILQCLPNLKTLQAICWINNGQIEDPTASSNQDVNSFMFPRMESLYYVYLRVDPLPNEILKAIISSFGNQLKKLYLPFQTTNSGVFHSALQNLSEICMCYNGSKNLMSIVVSELMNNAITVKKFKGKINYTDVYSLLDILQPLSLNVVSFGYSKLTEETIVNLNDHYLYDSIQTLEIRDRLALKYEFLKCMPNLEYLYIITSYEVESVFNSQTQENLENQLEIINQIRCCLYFGISPTRNFWKAFPKLKYVVVEYNNGDYGCIIPSYLKRPILRYARCPENL